MKKKIQYKLEFESLSHISERTLLRTPLHAVAFPLIGRQLEKNLQNFQGCHEIILVPASKLRSMSGIPSSSFGTAETKKLKYYTVIFDSNTCMLFRAKMHEIHVLCCRLEYTHALHTSEFHGYKTSEEHTCLSRTSIHP